MAMHRAGRAAAGGLRAGGRWGKECLGDEATVKLVQLLLGQHQPVSLSEASRTREGHFAQVHSVVLLLLLGLGVGEERTLGQGLTRP